MPRLEGGAENGVDFVRNIGRFLFLHVFRAIDAVRLDDGQPVGVGGRVGYLHRLPDDHLAVAASQHYVRVVHVRKFAGNASWNPGHGIFLPNAGGIRSRLER